MRESACLGLAAASRGALSTSCPCRLWVFQTSDHGSAPSLVSLRPSRYAGQVDTSLANRFRSRWPAIRNPQPASHVVGVRTASVQRTPCFSRQSLAGGSLGDSCPQTWPIGSAVVSQRVSHSSQWPIFSPRHLLSESHLLQGVSSTFHSAAPALQTGLIRVIIVVLPGYPQLPDGQPSALGHCLSRSRPHNGATLSRCSAR